jgi:hypothetical protein
VGLVRVSRGQLVLVAATVVALALVPVLLAYLQLGYHPGAVGAERDVTGEAAVELLDRSVHGAAAATAGEYRWAERSSMAAAVREDLEETVATLERSRIEEGFAYQVAYNGTAAAAWSETGCEAGEGRRFGACHTDGGIALQERAGEAVLLAVAFDVGVVGPDGESELTVVVTVGG